MDEQRVGSRLSQRLPAHDTPDDIHHQFVSPVSAPHIRGSPTRFKLSLISGFTLTYCYSSRNS